MNDILLCTWQPNMINPLLTRLDTYGDPREAFYKLFEGIEKHLPSSIEAIPARYVAMRTFLDREATFSFISVDRMDDLLKDQIVGDEPICRCLIATLDDAAFTVWQYKFT